MTALTDFRLYVKSVLDPALGITLQLGKLEGGVDKADVGCIFSVGTEEVDGQVDDQLLVVIVRVFKHIRVQRSPRKPVDANADLEEAGERIQAAMRAAQVGGGVWFSRVQSCEIDLDRNSVQATIVARMQNLAILG